jgi:hypothetical protein
MIQDMGLFFTYLPALGDAREVSVKSDVSAQALPVFEGPGPEVFVEFADDGAAGLLLAGHGLLRLVGGLYCWERGRLGLKSG